MGGGLPGDVTGRARSGWCSGGCGPGLGLVGGVVGGRWGRGGP